MKQLFVVYETDVWHTTANRSCAGLFTSKHSAINAIVRNHRIELDEIFKDDEQMTDKAKKAEARRIIRKELEYNFQTQGYSTNYDIEVWNVNDWAL